MVVARGDCNFVLKAALAQSYGAVGIVIASDELVSYARTTMSIAQLLWLLGVIVALLKGCLSSDLWGGWNNHRLQ